MTLSYSAQSHEPYMSQVQRLHDWMNNIFATLVFPALTPDGRAYLKQALERDEAVVTESCDVGDPTNGAASWAKLPLVNEPAFLGFKLNQRVEEERLS